LAAALKIESRDFSDLEVATELAGVSGEAPLRFSAEADRGFAFRLGVEMRFWDLETNKDRRVGVMFKAPCARDYWRSQKASSTAGEMAVDASAALWRRTRSINWITNKGGSR
jgi:hypothetical protein